MSPELTRVITSVVEIAKLALRWKDQAKPRRLSKKAKKAIRGRSFATVAIEDGLIDIMVSVQRAMDVCMLTLKGMPPNKDLTPANTVKALYHTVMVDIGMFLSELEDRHYNYASMLPKHAACRKLMEEMLERTRPKAKYMAKLKDDKLDGWKLAAFGKDTTDWLTLMETCMRETTSKKTRAEMVEEFCA